MTDLQRQLTEQPMYTIAKDKKTIAVKSKIKEARAIMRANPGSVIHYSQEATAHYEAERAIDNTIRNSMREMDCKGLLEQFARGVGMHPLKARAIMCGNNHLHPFHRVMLQRGIQATLG